MINNAIATYNTYKVFDELQEQLASHPLYNAITNKQQLIIFMEQHVFAVWDFMSLVKSAQHLIAPTSTPWIPSEYPRYVHFINQLVAEEESDHMYSDHAEHYPCSHFERYLEAMTSIGANTNIISSFIDTVRKNGLHAAFAMTDLPHSAKQFMTFTFDVINRNQPHLTVAVLALGRENLVPHLFAALQKNSNITRDEASLFFHYLDRHIQLDGEEHGPIANQLLLEICKGSSKKLSEAIEIAEQALTVRQIFWDEIYYSLTPNQQAQSFQ